MKKNQSKAKTIASKNDGSTSSILKMDQLEKIPSSTEIIPGILSTKWHEILEEEERDLMILQIRDELLNNTMEMCYKNYLEHQAIDFTVHCTYLALNEVIDCNFATRDPGEPNGIIGNPLWSGDTLPATLTKDTWAAQSVPVVKEPSLIKLSTLKNEEESHDETALDLQDTIPEIDQEQLQLQTDLQNLMSTEVATQSSSSDIQFRLPTSFSTEVGERTLQLSSHSSLQFKVRRRSTFSRTTSMTKERLPTAHLDSTIGTCVESKKETGTGMSKKGSRRVKGDSFVDDFVMIPDILEPARFQAGRIDVKYMVCPPETTTNEKKAAKPKLAMSSAKKKVDIIRLK